ncbi:MAG: hypothetical protein KKD64_09235 [Alphaproteobacteria bacterium]|jgi:hypothetical protein|nr:hypothetical protein [Alphaproteobacteria bacterium]MBU0794008.1 hypothetical protein [Alphaproteobacteria bacterium]MBU0874512.1 hypothetical protein [Alphaproteobacteria bacterium]MBU1769825.1 hypothetical protein [Alphaproteobacteria bacterium]
MDPVTIEDRRKELQTLLAQIQANPSRDWNRERQRIIVLQQMVAAEQPRARA